MRGGAAAALVTFALALAGTGCARSATPTTATNTSPTGKAVGSGVPTWLPAYNAAQRALLAPVDAPIQVRATRVFPDLRRFQYAGPARLDDVRRTLRFSSLIVS